MSKHKWLFADPLLLLSRHASVASISEIYCVGPCLQQSLPRRPQPHPNPGSCDPLAGCPFHSGTLENNLERVKRTSSRTANNVSPPSLCALHQSKLTTTCTLRWLLRVGERAAKACMILYAVKPTLPVSTVVSQCLRTELVGQRYHHRPRPPSFGALHQLIRRIG